MMQDNSVSAFMSMVDMATEQVFDEQRAIAEAKRHAKSDVAKMIAAGLISKPSPKPQVYVKKQEAAYKRESQAFTIPQIKEKLARYYEQRDKGHTVLEACKRAKVSQGNIHRWEKMVKEAEQ
jgi:hypothetical protein